MFEVGFQKILLIFAIALVALGRQNLPKLPQKGGPWAGRAPAMALQFREQLEEEASNLETKFDIDPKIDTSLEPKPAPAPAPGGGPPAPAASAPAAMPEEEFYPPDHHMHSSNRVRPADTAALPAESSPQTELDLTTP